MAREHLHIPTLFIGFVLGAIAIFGWQYAGRFKAGGSGPGTHHPVGPAPPPQPVPSSPPLKNLVDPPAVIKPVPPVTTPVPVPGGEAQKPAPKPTPSSSPSPSPSPSVPKPKPPVSPPAPSPAPAAPAPPPAHVRDPLRSSQQCVNEAISVIEARSRLRVLEPNERFGPPGSTEAGIKIVSEYDDDPFHGNANVIMTHVDCHTLHPCCQPLQGPDYDPDFGAGTTVDHIMFMVSCSSSRKEQCKAVRNGWARDFKLKDRLWLWSDTTDDALGTLVPPQFQDTPYFSSLKTNEQLYNVFGLQSLISTNPKYNGGSGGDRYREMIARTRWFFLVDDTTFVNLPRLIEHLNKLEHRLPLVYGYVWRSTADPNLPFNHISGDAGYVISHEAMSRLLPRLKLNKPSADAPAIVHTTQPDSCPWLGAYGTDIALSLCARRTGVLFVHSEMFQWTIQRNLWVMPGGHRLYLGVLNAITGHGLPHGEMRPIAEFCENYAKSFNPDWAPNKRHRFHTLPPLV